MLDFFVDYKQIINLRQHCGGAFLNDVGAEILLMEGHERQAN